MHMRINDSPYQVGVIGSILHPCWLKQGCTIYTCYLISDQLIRYCLYSTELSDLYCRVDRSLCLSICLSVRLIKVGDMGSIDPITSGHV